MRRASGWGGIVILLRAKAVTPNAARPVKGPQNAQRNYERYLALAQAEVNRHVIRRRITTSTPNIISELSAERGAVEIHRDAACRRGLSGLFATAAAPRPAARSHARAPQVEHDPAPQPSPVPHVLPKDLPGALARLSDPELDKLLVAAIDEARRRGRLPSNLGAKSRDTDQTAQGATQTKSRVARVAPPSWQSNTDDVSSSLTLVSCACRRPSRLV
jgi:hypothetical protein